MMSHRFKFKNSRFAIGVAILGCLLPLRVVAAQELVALNGVAGFLESPALYLADADPLGLAAIEGGADDSLYADGTRAIHESRWADAVASFMKVAQQGGEHAPAALYWKAYAENKLGQGAQALATCAELRKSYASSRWLDDCGALEIEVHGQSGALVEPQSGPDADLRVLALNSLMHKDAARAVEEIRALLASNQPETYKEYALFVLALSPNADAQALLKQTAASSTNPTLQARAARLLAAPRGPKPGEVEEANLIAMDVVVKTKDGKPATGLTAKDFTVYDNGKPQKLVYFQSMDQSGSSPNSRIGAATEVLILIDTVNSSLTEVAFERQQISEFLRMHGGQLPLPVKLMVFNGNGAVRIGETTRDGNALADALDKFAPNLHPIRRSEAFYGLLERVQASLNTLGELTTEEALRPGRKMLLWISPGWPLLPRSDFLATNRDRKATFDQIVALSTGMRLARLSLYSIDPVWTAGSGSLEWFRYKDFVKPVPSASRAELANLALQVLAEQSGGEALNFSNTYLSGEIADCIANANADYLLSIRAPADGKKNEYRSLKVEVNKPGVKVETRNGYYYQP